MEITTKNNSVNELKAKESLQKILIKYNPPVFTDRIIIEEKSIPHSHPVLTLNTRDIEERSYLELFIHEQLHWFASQHKHYMDCIEYLKEKYQDNGECNKSGKHPNSFWEHIIVCFNTRNILNSILPQKDVDYVYSKWTPYPMTEELVRENFEGIKAHLKKFDMICET